MMPSPNPEWTAMADREPYRIGYTLTRTSHRWYVYDMRTGETLARFNKRDDAIKHADALNERGDR